MSKAFLITYCTALVVLAALFCSSCALLNRTPEQTAAMIRSTARISTFEALKRGYTDGSARVRGSSLIYASVEFLRQLMERDPNGVQVGDLREILALFAYSDLDLPPELKISLVTASDLVLSYVRVDSLEALLTVEERLYLDAFLDGVQEGARPFCGVLRVEIVE